MMPTTMAVAWGSLMERRSVGGMESRDSTTDDLRFIISKLSTRACGPRNFMKMVSSLRQNRRGRSGEIGITLENSKPISCLIRSVLLSELMSVVSPAIGGTIARDPA